MATKTRKLVPKTIPFGGKSFSAVKRVRDKLREDSEALYTEFRTALKMAVAGGNYEAAIKGYTWLFPHIPADEDGTRIIDSDIDKQQPLESENKGPVIQIGFSLGGVNKLEQPAIEVKSIPVKTPKSIN